MITFTKQGTFNLTVEGDAQGVHVGPTDVPVVCEGSSLLKTLKITNTETTMVVGASDLAINLKGNFSDSSGIATPPETILTTAVPGLSVVIDDPTVLSASERDGQFYLKPLKVGSTTVRVRWTPVIDGMTELLTAPVTFTVNAVPAGNAMSPNDPSEDRGYAWYPLPKSVRDQMSEDYYCLLYTSRCV